MKNKTNLICLYIISILLIGCSDGSSNSNSKKIPNGYLKNKHKEKYDNFGSSVAISGDGKTLAVSAIGEDSANKILGTGAVYVFTSPSWENMAWYKASNGKTYDQFGNQIALSGDGKTLVISSPIFENSVYVFTRLNDNSWTQTAQLKTDDREKTNFGRSLAISKTGKYIAVGAMYNKYQKGSVYIYTKPRCCFWEQIKQIKSNENQTFNKFGSSLAISDNGNTLAIIDKYKNEEKNKNTGVYVYTHSNNSNWTKKVQLEIKNTNNKNYFGHSVAMSNNGKTIAVSAIGEDGVNNITDASAVYIFTRSGNNSWTQTAQLEKEGEQFGHQIALSGDGKTVAVKNEKKDKPSTVYVFTRSGNNSWTQTAQLEAFNKRRGD